jgi:phosphatidate phosphatase PAH1
VYAPLYVYLCVLTHTHTLVLCVQADTTREFLRWVEQTGTAQAARYRLPDGPCICAPDRLLTAFHRYTVRLRACAWE